ncbi:MAG TPA: TetR/AcrR family transcriptional regulator [Nonomuraea sp.]|nr:TetR/AcrR family transcriptional regulator [Nonomuraea sp.]
MVTTKHSNTPLSDRRVRRTRAALARALLQLVEERDLSRISVSDVAERAEVSRTAFYDHYRNVHELAEDACTAMIDAMVRSLPAPTLSAEGIAPEAVTSLQLFFAGLAEHAGLYRSLLGPQGSAYVADHIRRRSTAAIHHHLHPAAAAPESHHPDIPRRDTSRANPRTTPHDAPRTSPPDTPSGTPHDAPYDDPHDVQAAFIAGALLGVANDWLQRGCPQSPADMAALTWPLFRALAPLALNS